MNHEPQIVEVNMEEIIPNRFQPRRSFEEQGINELAASIKEHGIIQPLVLRRLQDKYEIIAGERRFKAATLAGLTKVPAIITDLDDNQSAEVALVENIQRRDLTPIEEAKSYKNLLDRGYINQDELAKKMGISQSAISNKLRLLNLDEEVQEALLSNKISERHARSLLVVSDKNVQKELLQKIIDERLTVRQLDMEIKRKENNMVMDDAPIIDIMPTVDEIKNSAMDINPIKESLPISDMLATEREKSGEPAPVAQPIAPQEEEQAKGRFFNFLEDEAVNLDMSDGNETVPVSTPDAKPSIFPSNEPTFASFDTINPITPASILETSIETNTDEDTSVSNSPVEVNETPELVVEPIINAPSTSELNPPTFEKLFEDDELPKPKISVAEDIVDPVSKIEELNPNYVPPKIEEETYKLTDAINEIRDLKSSIESKGLLVELEELDLDKLYQVIIKIDKDNL